MDLEKFVQASFKPRTKTFKVPSLKDFFGEGEDPVWVVRGLSAAELAMAELDSLEGRNNLNVLINAAMGDGERAEALRSSLGLSQEEIPKDTAKRIAELCLGSTDPVLGMDKRDVAVQLAQSFPLVFYNLTNAIQNLSGQGCEQVKPSSSGETENSELQ